MTSDVCWKSEVISMQSNEFDQIRKKICRTANGACFKTIAPCGRTNRSDSHYIGFVDLQPPICRITDWYCRLTDWICRLTDWISTITSTQNVAQFRSVLFRLSPGRESKKIKAILKMKSERGISIPPF